MLPVSKKRTAIISSGIILIFLLSSYYFYKKMENRSKVIINLKTYSNISISNTPPQWISKTPSGLRPYLEKTFSINIDFNSAENVDLFGSNTKKSKASYKDFISKIKDIQKINELVLNLQEIDDETLFFIDELTQLNHIKRLKIFGNRLAISTNIKSRLKLEECYVAADSIAPAALKALTKSSSLKVLTLKSTTTFSPRHLEHLQHLTHLKELMIEDISSSPEHLNFIKNLQNLTHLNLGTASKILHNEGNASRQSLGKYYDLSSHVDIISSLPKLQKLDANILLTKDNLSQLNQKTLIPTAYYDIPANIDDTYLELFGQFLGKISKDNEHLKFGLIDKIKTRAQSAITDKSLPYFKKYTPSTLDLRHCNLKTLEGIPLEQPSKIFFTKETYTKEIISRLTHKEYEILDFSNTSFSDHDLKQLLTQTMPRILFLENSQITDKTIDILMQFFDEHPKERLKVSFGEMDIPENRRTIFLQRVHQWGMLQVFSSHLNKEISFPTWAVHTSKNIVHDRQNHLVDLHDYFPQLNSINLQGKALTVIDWQGLLKLRLLHTLILNSPQNHEAIEKSSILQKIYALEINAQPHEPIEIGEKLETCRLTLQSHHLLEDFISIKSQCSQKLIINGQGTVNLSIFEGVKNLRELTIGPDIKVIGTFPQIPELIFLRCMPTVDNQTLKSLTNLVNITKLVCDLRNLQPQTFQSFPAMRNLRALDLSTATLNTQDLEVLVKMPKIEILSLPQNDNITQAILSTLKKLPGLYKLGINGTLIPSTSILEKYEIPLLWDYLP